MTPDLADTLEFQLRAVGINNEHDLQTRIIQIITDRGGVATRVNSGGAISKRGGRIKLAEAGTSDIIACYRGQYLAIEVKYLDGKVSKEQEEFGVRVEAAGGWFVVVRGLSNFDNVFAKIEKYLERSENANNQDTE